ncbi:MAG: DUF1501 domain-containing protein [Pseudomonadota bacterium]
MTLTRRSFLGTACSLAAHPLITPMAMAAAPTDHRLVVILLRGGMDGLDAVRPIGSRNLSTLRQNGMTELGFDLDGYFAASEGFNALQPLWAAGELAFAHAVSTPYRDKRSHFDGQDILEAGSVGVDGTRDGWLNRLLQILPGAEAQTGFAVGGDQLRILEGDAPVLNWAPDTPFMMSDQDRLLLEHIYADDDVFHSAINEASMLVGTGMAMGEGGGTNMSARRGDQAAELARFTADQLLGDTRIASFTINGWDTHRRQSFQLKSRLEDLSNAILALRDGLGPVWSKTTVLAMTEFGRTAAMNGSFGTDHGTGGAMVMSGGAVKGGKVYGRWPGLAEADLYDRRDLMPTMDVRAFAGSVIGDLFGIGASDIERTVFPGLVWADRPSVVL